MFELEYKGGNGVLITSGGTPLWVDAGSKVREGKVQDIKSDVQIATEKRFMAPRKQEGVDLEGPGEYEVGPYTIRGIAARRHIDTQGEVYDTTIYRIDAGDIRVAIVGNIAMPLSDEQLEAIGVVDVLVVPVGGGGYTLDAHDAAKLVRQVAPRIVVPIHYADAGLSYEVPQEEVEAFVKALGLQPESTAKLRLKSPANIPPSLTLTVVERTTK